MALTWLYYMYMLCVGGVVLLQVSAKDVVPVSKPSALMRRQEVGVRVNAVIVLIVR